MVLPEDGEGAGILKREQKGIMPQGKEVDMTPMKRTIILLVLCISLTGCDTFPEPEESKAFLCPFCKQSRYECMWDAQVAWGWAQQQELYLACMDAKGFTVKRTGLLRFFGKDR